MSSSSSSSSSSSHSLLSDIEKTRSEGTECVAFDSKSQRLMGVTSRAVYRGIHNVLGQSYYPSYVYGPAAADHTTTTTTGSGGSADREISGSRASSKPEPTGTRARVRESKPTPRCKRPRSSGPVAGQRRGIRVDGDLNWVVQNMRYTGRVLSQYTKTARSHVASSSSTRGSGADSYPGRGLHPYSRSIIAYLCKHELRLVACQLSVSCAATRIATPIDALCYDPSAKRLLLLEIKTGFTGYHNRPSARGDGKMRHPYTDRTDCPENQHQLQLAANKLLFCHAFGQAPSAVSAWVLRVDKHGVTCYPEATWARTSELSMLLFGR